MMLEKIVLCLQVRTNSHRFKRKAFSMIKGNYFFLHCYYDLKKKFPDFDVWVLTSGKKSDDTLSKILKNKKINCFRGNLENIVERFYSFSKKYNYKNYVRFTADNPFVAKKENNELIKKHIRNNYDYSSNLDNLPKGKGIDIFSNKLINDTFKKGKVNKNLNKHLNSYIVLNKSNYKVNILTKKNLDISYTIDTYKEYIKNIIKK
jgi:spore coat polysaccharide biosynthesis protein SpsF